MKRISLFIFFITFSLFYSCSGVKDTVKGFWSIDTINYKGQNLLYDLQVNTISFKSGNCILPEINEVNKLKANSKESTWEIVRQDKKYLLNIKTGNEIFAGTHQICFKKDFEKKLIKMVITSENLSIECSKWLVNFDKENKGINEYLCN